MPQLQSMHIRVRELKSTTHSNTPTHTYSLKVMDFSSHMNVYEPFSESHDTITPHVKTLFDDGISVQSFTSVQYQIRHRDIDIQVEGFNVPLESVHRFII